MGLGLSVSGIIQKMELNRHMQTHKYMNEQNVPNVVL